ncbi:AraC family transcriptional regulator [Polynucleobacter sp. AP-Titi-500A-B4]|jgi:AraC-like DNA-binding protein|uniref:helix-turn-helix domain-containing protein n=1 Tax=Polynucleobacter sp. AP-Titi-500A-B4 TaxID=2576923 RepID=UPI001BFEDEE4|nr:AraC family transcriptional regulator [Polynucleobacter sp. AP-Titi-500A-B4]QWE13266.1 helix-turn-helix transcriptional regulator [Polynucleobacter sp. AP-Titi-500A-B4]
MSKVIRLLHGEFGRVALLEMDAPLVTHAHHHCHILCKVGGPDTAFQVRGKNCPLTNDNAVLINAWEEHSYLHLPVGGSNPVLLALYLEPKWLASFSKKFLASSHPRFFMNNLSTLGAHQKQALEKISMELWWSDQITHEQLESMLLELTLGFMESADVLTSGDLRNTGNTLAFMDPRIRKAIHLMRTSPQGFTDIATVAQSVNLSRSHFFELFRRCTGLSPVVFANVLRMEFAFDALADKDESLIHIGDELGFSAQGHFTRFFKQHQGVTPSLYRQQVEKAPKLDS